MEVSTASAQVDKKDSAPAGEANSVENGGDKKEGSKSALINKYYVPLSNLLSMIAEEDEEGALQDTLTETTDSKDKKRSSSSRSHDDKKKHRKHKHHRVTKHFSW